MKAIGSDNPADISRDISQLSIPKSTLMAVGFGSLGYGVLFVKVLYI